MSTQDANRLYALLAYAGAIPFVACAALSAGGWTGVPYLPDVATLAASYALLIVAFMAGTHWGLALRLAPRPPAAVLLASNAIALVAWLGFLLAPLRAGLIISAGAFVILYFVDRYLRSLGAIDDPYLRTRRNVSLIVVLALAVTAAGSS